MRNEILKHFEKNDPVIFSFLRTVEISDLEKSIDVKTYFTSICGEIIGQQLSGKVANLLFSRFRELFQEKEISPSKVLKKSHEELRAIGISNSKASYIRNIAESVERNELEFEKFEQMTDEKIIAQLTKVKGIGGWTADMFLIFTLGRENIYSFGDLGLKKGMMKVYGFTNEPTKNEVEKIINKWSPFKSYGSLALWKSLD